MPNGSRQVPCARAMASLKSAAVSSSQCTEGLLCAAGDCAQRIEEQSAFIESSSDLYKCPPAMGLRLPREALHKSREAGGGGVARVTRVGARAAHLRRSIGDTRAAVPAVR